MRTIKLVIVGGAGVGKTSLRNQYISGRFSTGYRATIGTDFITKTLPHHSDPNESVTLQIWDTAGQERFSSLSAAFFRGADAVMLVFDVNKPETLHALRTWWDEFRKRAPVREGDEAEYCCVVVGNKLDLAPNKSPQVSMSDAWAFLHDLIPLPPSQYPSLPDISSVPYIRDYDAAHPLARALASERPIEPVLVESSTKPLPHSERLATVAAPPLQSAQLIDDSHFVLHGTMTTTRTTLSMYHTPSSSLFSTPLNSVSPAISPEPGASPSASTIQQFTTPRSTPSPSSPTRARYILSSSSSGTTITPARSRSPLHRSNKTINTNVTTESVESSTPPLTTASTPAPPSPTSNHVILPDIGPYLLFASAKTGASVSDAFEYIAKRVVVRWEWEERQMEVSEGDEDDRRSEVKLGSHGKTARWWSSCCST
ncbi:hypothetical protein BOTBODRAFT_53076 [Botryobasidium botryosum FD-172 SS1]|uniref:Ras-domain-containing protein n=1 Tax=Botryobasidium botryosum (strain FD-172 SS1) TaxID=930990 RepID=A0A067MPJ4_BOTB1|nr:hypothetical protein BOTBODRAFT_53076 [Botryobasidium botryosum FD-172 SS1]